MTKLNDTENRAISSNGVLYAVGSVVRLKPEVEQEKKAHTGKHFKVIGYVGRFLKLQWQEQDVLFLADEVDAVATNDI